MTNRAAALACPVMSWHAISMICDLPQRKRQGWNTYRPAFSVTFALSRTAFLVVIFPLDLAAGTVLLAVHLLSFGTVQVASIGCALIANLLIDTGLALVGARGLAGGHLT